MRVVEFRHSRKWGRAVRAVLEYAQLAAWGYIGGELLWLALYLFAITVYAWAR